MIHCAAVDRFAVVDRYAELVPISEVDRCAELVPISAVDCSAELDPISVADRYAVVARDAAAAQSVVVDLIWEAAQSGEFPIVVAIVVQVVQVARNAELGVRCEVRGEVLHEALHEVQLEVLHEALHEVQLEVLHEAPHEVQLEVLHEVLNVALVCVAWGEMSAPVARKLRMAQAQSQESVSHQLAHSGDSVLLPQAHLQWANFRRVRFRWVRSRLGHFPSAHRSQQVFAKVASGVALCRDRSASDGDLRRAVRRDRGSPHPLVVV